MTTPVVLLTCKWCIPELQGGTPIPGGGEVVSIQCTGSVRPDLLLDAFSRGAQGAVIVGCAKDDCHFVTGNSVAGDNVAWVQDVLGRAGIDPRRVRFELMAHPTAGDVFPIVDEMRTLCDELGPLELKAPAANEPDERDLLKVIQGFRGYQCLDCGKCTAVCSVAEIDTRFSPRGIVQLVTGEPRDDVLASGDIWQCRACGRCTVRCPQNVEFSSLIRELRVEAINAGHAPQKLHGGVLQFLWSLAKSPAFKHDFGDWPGDGIELDPESDVAFYPGCLPFYEATFSRQWDGVHPMETATACIKLLNAAGVKPRLLEDVGCCGHDLHWTGQAGEFGEVAEANVEKLNAAGIKTLVTNCPECTVTFGQTYTAVGCKPKAKVQHLMEFLAAHLPEMEFTNGDTSTVTYHDSCRMVRHLSVVDQPRQVLGAVPGVELKEMAYSGDRADCCGSAGWTGCTSDSKRTQLERLQMAKGTGADVLLASCPKCFLHYNCAREDVPAADAPIPVVDVFKFLADKLEA